jgi:hypothetical protein
MYMFRAISCSSSGGQIVLIQHLISSLSVSDHMVHKCTGLYMYIYIYIYIYIYTHTHTHTHIRGVSPTCFNTATTKLLQTEEPVNYSSLVANGSKNGILFSLKIVHTYWNMSEIRLKCLRIVHIVHLVGEMKRSALLKCEHCVDLYFYVCRQALIVEVMIVCRYL